MKNVYTGNERTLTRKVKEAILANRVDRKLSKDEILFRYLNTIYLGEGAYGVGAASETYFRKAVKDLTLSEAALLAGIIPAPSVYQPRGNPDGAEQPSPQRAQADAGRGLHHRKRQHDAAIAADGVARRRAASRRVRSRSSSRRSRSSGSTRTTSTTSRSTCGPAATTPIGPACGSRPASIPKIQDAAEKAVTDALSGTAAPLGDGAGVGRAADGLRQSAGRWARLLQRALGQREPRARRLPEEARRRRSA